MDDWFFLLFIFAAVAIGAWLLRRRGRKRRRDKEAARWAELTRRVYELEKVVAELKSGQAVSVQTAQAPAEQQVPAWESISQLAVAPTAATEVPASNPAPS